MKDMSRLRFSSRVATLGESGLAASTSVHSSILYSLSSADNCTVFSWKRLPTVLGKRAGCSGNFILSAARGGRSGVRGSVPGERPRRSAFLRRASLRAPNSHQVRSATLQVVAADAYELCRLTLTSRIRRL